MFVVRPLLMRFFNRILNTHANLTRMKVEKEKKKIEIIESKFSPHLNEKIFVCDRKKRIDSSWSELIKQTPQEGRKMIKMRNNTGRYLNGMYVCISRKEGCLQSNQSTFLFSSSFNNHLTIVCAFTILVSLYSRAYTSVQLFLRFFFSTTHSIVRDKRWRFSLSDVQQHICTHTDPHYSDLLK